MMAFVTPLLIGAAAGAASTWAYLQRQQNTKVRDVTIESTVEPVAVESAVEAETKTES